MSEELTDKKNSFLREEPPTTVITTSRGFGLTVAATCLLCVLTFVSKSDNVSQNSEVVNDRRLSNNWNRRSWFNQVSTAKKRLAGYKLLGSIDGIYSNGGFGSSVSLSEKGYIVASSPRGGDKGQGSVRVFTTTGDQIQDTILGENAGDEFGYSVTMSSRFVSFAVGAPSVESSTGTVYVYNLRSYRYIDAHGVFTGNRSGDNFGAVVSMSSDGTYLAIGASGSEDAPGYIRVYTCNSNNKWYPVFDDFYGSGFKAGDGFGSVLSISPDGNFVIVGIPKLDLVQIYRIRNTNKPQLEGPNLKGEKGEGFGNSVAMTTLSLGIVVGSEAGTVRLYTYMNGTYRKFANDVDGEEGFGHSVSISSDGRYFVSGSPKENAVSVYYNSGSGWQSIGKGYGDQEGDEAGYSVYMTGIPHTFGAGSPGAKNGDGNVKIYRF